MHCSWGVPVFLHAGKSARFELAPGWHKVRDSEEDDEFVLRTGFSWDFEIGGGTLTPSIFYDISEGENLFVAGLAVGKGW